MQRTLAALLAGSLSMLFAEVLSGASRTWFADAWGVLLVLPIYLAHIMFFLWIATRSRRTSLPQLYLFGVMFALYESWMTKVLWAGYPWAKGPDAGTVLGVSTLEYPILVFFWHPVMSFIAPVLVFQILTRTALVVHEAALRKSRRKSVLIGLSLIPASVFAAFGNGYSPVLASASVGGTLLVVFGLYAGTKRADLRSLVLTTKGFVVLTGYLIVLYALLFVFASPHNRPAGITPYVTILATYAVQIALLAASKAMTTETVPLTTAHYSATDVAKYAVGALLLTNLACLLPAASNIIFVLSYFSLVPLGVVLYLAVVMKRLWPSSGRPRQDATPCPPGTTPA